MGVIMGKIVEVKGKPTQLIVQALDEEDLEKQVNAINEMERKAKAFDAIVNIEDDFVKYHGFSPCVEEYTEEVEDIISKYLEDKQND